MTHDVSKGFLQTYLDILTSIKSVIKMPKRRQTQAGYTVINKHSAKYT